MKNTFYILIALVLLMVACGRPSGNAPLSAELQRAEDLIRQFGIIKLSKKLVI